MSEIGAARAGLRRAQALAAVATLAALFLIAPPFVTLFVLPGTILGLPPIVLYIFGVWAGAVAAAFLLARRFARAAEGEGPG